MFKRIYTYFEKIPSEDSTTSYIETNALEIDMPSKNKKEIRWKIRKSW